MSLDSSGSAVLKPPSSRMVGPKEKFFILCQFRTGSTLLASLLNSHPKLYCDGELFNFRETKNYFVAFPRRYVNRQVKKAAKEEQPQCYGFDLKMSQIDMFYKYLDSTRVVRKLYQDGWKIIYLRREHIVKQAISNLVARKRQKWHYWSEQDKRLNTSAVRIEPTQLLRTLRSLQRLTKLEDQALQNLNYQELIYERDLLEVAAHQKTADQIFQYLGLPSAKVETSLIRTSSAQLSDSVQNFDEILELLRGTEYEQYLL